MIEGLPKGIEVVRYGRPAPREVVLNGRLERIQAQDMTHEPGFVVRAAAGFELIEKWGRGVIASPIFDEPMEVTVKFSFKTANEAEALEHMRNFPGYVTED